ncbi:LuxR family transcriptional regulator, partial [Mycobacterium asiaticum]|uniref:LuxR family transcriptional regulator n=1 Tax=Mycobacterium asiaticum TaxID=1790 RepID=UPI0012DB764D
VRSRHCDHYTAIAARLDAPARTDYEQRLEQVETEMDNLRNALGWDLENHDTERALALASSLQPVWLSRGRVMEGRAWFQVIPTETANLSVAPAVHARALADEAVLNFLVGETTASAARAVEIARELGDPALLARTLSACGVMAGAAYDGEAAAAFYAEAVDLARASGDQWRLSQILTWQANTGLNTGDPHTMLRAGEEGRAIADLIGDRASSRGCRLWMGWALLLRGNVTAAITEFAAVVADCDRTHDDLLKPIALMGWGLSLGYHGDVEASAEVAATALNGAVDLGEFYVAMAYAHAAQAGLASGDLDAAYTAGEEVWLRLKDIQPEASVAQRAFNSVEAALGRGDFIEARRLADAAVAVAKGWHLVAALSARARIALAAGSPGAGEQDAHDALACAVERGVHLHIPDILECLAGVASRNGDLPEAARLFGAALGLRQRMGLVRFRVHEAAYAASVDELRNMMGAAAFDAAWAEGVTLSPEEAIAYAQRGRGQRKRPDSGWGSLTPAERDVARLVCEGMANKEIATRLFVSPRTVQAHLTHIYTKLGINSRVQLVQEAARQG